MSSLFLEILGGDGKPLPPAELPSQGRLVIGSSPERASLVVTGQGVAAVHCTIGRIKGGGWALKDLGSEFGTIVNGERVDTARLSAGDEILIGSRKLRIFSPSDAEPARSKTPTPEPAKTPAVETPAAKTPAPKTTARQTPSRGATRAPGNGRVPAISGYVADRLLGHGGMGDVFLATQESLQRRVALKILKSKLANDSTFVERFRDEARAAARLNHPNIVTVYDVGEDGGKHFLSMEFMAGGSIEARLVELGPLPWREALDVIRDAAAGLVYAESRGIVHRDIKPENLMRNQDGVTKIADLGLAVQVEQETVESSGGKIFGTPHFIAPEVIRGQPADARSDLYSLGVTAYRILSGHTPFEGATSRDILRASLNEEPAMLASRVPGIPPAFDTLVHRLLEKDPEMRHPSASVLLAELERMRQGDTSLPGDSAPRSSHTIKFVLAGAAVATIAGMVMFGGGGDPDQDDDTGGFRSRTDGAQVEAVPGGPDTGNGSQVGDGVETTDGDGGSNGTAPDSAGEGAGGGSGTGADPTSIRGEVEVEFEAQLAYQQLSDELLTSADRAARLRALAVTFAGTDTATRALEEAEQLETGDVTTETDEAQRLAGIDATLKLLRAAANLDQTPFHAGQALRSMQLVEGQQKFEGDDRFVEQRKALVDAILKKSIAGGRAAQVAASTAEAAGDFVATQSALREFIALMDLPSAEEAPLLLGATAPATLVAFQTLAVNVREQLAALSGREAEFEALRVQREWAAVADQLGGSLEQTLRDFDLTSASERVRSAVGIVSDTELQSDLTLAANDLGLAQHALDALISGFQTPGWRRYGVLDPRPGQSGKVDVVGTATNGLMLGDSGASNTVPLSLWCGQTKALENLFRGRLSRDWSDDEERGILVLLTVSATVESLRQLEPALQAGARRINESSVEQALKPFDEALDWAARNDDLRAHAQRQRDAVEALAGALIAREDGKWGLSAMLVRRLLDERRATWIVMLLSDGGRR